MEELGFFQVDGFVISFSMSGFLEAVSKVSKFALRWDDDVYDRLSHRYTVMVCALFTVIVSTKQYVGDPISCWCPATFTDAMIEYTNHVCWISNTYYLPIEKMPDKHGVERLQVIGYYQWVPLMLLLQGLFCYIPSIVWAMNNGRPGLDMNRMVLLVSGMESINPDIRDKSIKFICKHFDRALAYQREYRRSRYRRCLQSMSKHFCLPIGQIYGNYLTSLYVLVKILYIVNAVGQLYVMNAYLTDGRDSYYFYGVEVVKALFANRQPETFLFPRVTLCDFRIRQMQNVHDYTIQCTLPINLFNEKIYIYLWFHMCCVLFFSTFGFLQLLWQLFSTNCQSYITRYLKVICKVRQQTGMLEVRSIRHFVTDYLRPDGVFAIRVIAKNTNDIVTTEIIGALYDYYRKCNYQTTKTAPYIQQVCRERGDDNSSVKCLV
ncbi:innexin unc-9-like [Watersipora subatra]|uniref:innexin unc-9-like n=1 Tax=Watersipora subatra TaxID=2589382 RepID=UPI00355AE96C